MMTAVDDAPVVDADEPLEVLEALLGEGARDHDAGIVDENMGRAVGRLDVACEGLDGARVGDVDDGGRELDGMARELVGRLVESGPVDVGEGEGTAPLGEPQRGGAADSAGGAGDDGNAAFDACMCWSSLPGAAERTGARTTPTLHEQARQTSRDAGRERSGDDRA